MGKWYCKIDGVEAGPFSEDELSYLKTRGSLTASTEVRRGGDGSWGAAQTTLTSLFAANRSSSNQAVPRAMPRPKQVVEPENAESSIDEQNAPSPPHEVTPPLLPRAAARSTTPSSQRTKRAAIGTGIGVLAGLVLLLLLLLLNRPPGGSGLGKVAGSGEGNGSGKGAGNAGALSRSGSDGEGSQSGGTEDDADDGEEIETTVATSESEGASPDASKNQNPGDATDDPPPPRKDAVVDLSGLAEVAAPDVSRPPGRSGAGQGGGSGDVAERLAREGGKTGDVQITLVWNNYNDIDLHVICPSGERISYQNRKSRCGGELDVDMNADRMSNEPVENIYWPEGGAPRGSFKVYIHHYANKGGRDPTPFEVIVKVDGQRRTFRGRTSHGDRPKLMYQFRR